MESRLPLFVRPLRPASQAPVRPLSAAEVYRETHPAGTIYASPEEHLSNVEREEEGPGKYLLERSLGPFDLNVATVIPLFNINEPNANGIVDQAAQITQREGDVEALAKDGRVSPTGGVVSPEGPDVPSDYMIFLLRETMDRLMSPGYTRATSELFACPMNKLQSIALAQIAMSRGFEVQRCKQSDGNLSLSYFLVLYKKTG